MEELNIGLNIKNLRLQQSLSIRKLAALANITPSMLSQIESEQVNPSINTLREIARALDTPLYYFFRQENIEDVVVKSTKRISIGLNDGSDVRYELLTPDTKGDIEFCMMIIPPKSVSNTVIQCHKGEEVAYMLSGNSVFLDIEGTILEMQQGDSVRIPAGARHSWDNENEDEVQVIFAITPPTF